MIRNQAEIIPSLYSSTAAISFNGKELVGYLENKKLLKRAQEAEGELTIIKGIGNTSPEMKSLKTEIKNLKWIKDRDYIFLVDENKKLHEELKNVKKEAENQVHRMRKAGM